MEELRRPAAALEGLELPGGWRTKERLEKPSGATGGHFSESYIVENAEGKMGFLKALDYSAALAQPNTAERLREMTDAYLFEVGILQECAEARMSRVVLAVGHGEVEVPGYGLLSKVNYLIFEKAERDARRHRDLLPALDLAWALRTLHHVATGLFQLHGKGITHQDLKPSNVLVFSDDSSKIGDLGRSSKAGQASPFDEFKIAGDRNYAPPELLYAYEGPDPRVRRRACDMYQLGSMVLFFFMRVGTTGALASHLDPSHLWRNWSEGYEAVLPYVVDAFDHVGSTLEEELPEWLRPRLGRAFRELCHPDPSIRGDTRNRPGTPQQYSLERYVSHLDLLARHAELRLEKSVTS